MALIKCPECGHDVSTLAENCPNCGAPVALAIKEEKERYKKLAAEEAERKRIIQEKLKFSEPQPEEHAEQPQPEIPTLESEKDGHFVRWILLSFLAIWIVVPSVLFVFTCVFQNHKYDNGVETQSPTCGHVGTMTYTCKKCGKSYTDSIPVRGKHVWIEAKNAYPKHCSVCGEFASGCAIDGHWRDRMEDHAQFEFVIDTKSGTYDVYELFESTKYGNDCKLFSGEITSYSDNEITTSGGWVFVYNGDDTVTVKDADFIPYPLTRYSSGTQQTKVNVDLTDPSKTVVEGKQKSADYTSTTFTNAEAFAVAEEIVKDNLKSPSSAKFCKVTEATITKLSSTGDYMVEGWVDAENSFGAMLRAEFLVTFTPIKDGKDIGYKNASCIID